MHGKFNLKYYHGDKNTNVLMFQLVSIKRKTLTTVSDSFLQVIAPRLSHLFNKIHVHSPIKQSASQSVYSDIQFGHDYIPVTG